MAGGGVIQGTKGSYHLLGPIAQGAMGVVELARLFSPTGTLLGEVAIKRIRPELFTDELTARMFRDEADLSSRLSHPNIVRVLEAGSSAEGEPFLAMELVRGVTLQELVQRLVSRDRILPVLSAMDVIMQVLDGLAYAHRAIGPDGAALNVVHRDVSPQNIMVSYTGEVKLFDFGVGKTKNNAHQTNPGLIKGKLAFMSPEQIRNAEVDARSDLFSVGVLAYEALVLVHPFYGKTDASLLRAIMERDPPDPREIDPEFPAELATLLLRALEKEPARRFKDARAMREALDRFLSGRVFPKSASLAELVQDQFRSRQRMEARARKRQDDQMLLQALRGELDEAGEVGPGMERDVAISGAFQRRGERMFADLPTADIVPAGLSLEPGSGSDSSDLASSDLPGAEEMIDLGFLADAAPAPLFATRFKDGRLLFANEPMRRMFALGEETVYARDLYANPKDRRKLAEALAERHFVEGWLMEARRLDGSVFWASLSGRLVEREGAELIVGSVTDVTARVEIESRLARRLGHERRLAQAGAALLRARDSDPGEVGLREALEHLRAGTDADRIVLVQNELRADGVLLMHRRLAVGVESPIQPDRGRVPYDRVPRWRAVLERGDAIRGTAETFPDAERSLLDGWGVRALLAVPCMRRGQWLGFLAVEATEGRIDWTDDDVAAIETAAGILAGELARRRARSRHGAHVEGEVAAALSLGAQLGEALSRPMASEPVEALRRLRSMVVGGADLSSERPDLRQLLAGIEPRLHFAPDLSTRVEVGAELIEGFWRAIAAELALQPGFEARCARAGSGDLELRLSLPAAEAESVWAALRATRRR